MFVLGFVAVQGQVAAPVGTRRLRTQNKEFVFNSLFGGNNNNNDHEVDMGSNPGVAGGVGPNAGGGGGNIIETAVGMFLPMIQNLVGDPTQLLKMGMGIISSLINAFMGLLGGGASFQTMN